MTLEAEMADSGPVRQERHQRHKTGDHSMCRNCYAIRAKRPPKPKDGPVDLVKALHDSANRLAAVCEVDPQNVAAAHELRLTLETLAKMGPTLSDPMDELVAMASGVS
jgi:hypothetical protein